MLYHYITSSTTYGHQPFTVLAVANAAGTAVHYAAVHCRFTFGCTWRSGCSSHKDGALRSLRLCCGWTIYMEFLANVTARPVINTDILLSPTEDLSLQQSIRFISTLVTVILLLERANVTTPYIHTYLWCIRQTYHCPSEPH